MALQCLTRPISFAACLLALATSPTLAVPDETPAYDPTKRTVSPVKLRLRGAFHDPSVLNDPNNETKKERLADPFLFAYSDDRETDEVTLTLKGAVFGSLRVDNPAGSSPSIASYAFGVVVDQVDINGAQSRDTLEFRVGGAWLFGDSRPNVFWRSHYINADIGWLTDNDFDLGVLTASAQYEPFGRAQGFAGAPYSIGNFSFQARPSFVATYQNVRDDGGRAEFAGDADRFYVGGQLKVIGGFQKGPLKRLSFDASYQVLADLTGNASDTELFDAGLNWALDAESNVALRLDYTRGDTPSAAFTDKLTAGLALAF